VGRTRTLSHNLQIASLLSFVAGIVNVTGYLAVQKLTTNVTGHFAFLIEEVYAWHISQAITFSLYVFFFFLGSFFSRLMVDIVARKNDSYLFMFPIFFEAIFLAFIGLYGVNWMHTHADYIAFGLLFAMGLQNSLVTTISKSVIRTT